MKVNIDKIKKHTKTVFWFVILIIISNSCVSNLRSELSAERTIREIEVAKATKNTEKLNKLLEKNHQDYIDGYTEILIKD